MADRAFLDAFYLRRRHLAATYTTATPDAPDAARTLAHVVLTPPPAVLRPGVLLPPTFHEPITLTVRMLKGGTTTQVEATRATSVERLRELVATKLGVAPDNQGLVLGGRALPAAGRRLFDFAIDSGAVLTLLVKNASATPSTPSTTQPMDIIDNTMDVPSTQNNKEDVAVARSRRLADAAAVGDLWRQISGAVRANLPHEGDADVVCDALSRAYAALCGSAAPIVRKQLRDIA